MPLLVYASILPLEYVPIPWDEAVAKWQKIPWLQLGVSNRADWIANGLVVIPITFCLCGACGYRRRVGLLTAVFFSFIMLCVAAIVFGIEGLQVWFPRRTTSINDILAGWIGAFLGVFAWIAVGNRATDFLLKFLSLESVGLRLRWLSIAACALSLLYSLFPFDFVVSVEELLSKIALGRIGILGAAHDGISAESLKGFIASLLRMLPFGIAIGLGPKHRFIMMQLAAVSLLLELMQIPVYSKYSSLLDWAAGMMGGVLGYSAVRWTNVWDAIRQRTWVWRLLIAVWFVVLYSAYVGIWPFEVGRTMLLNDEAIRQKWRSFVDPPFLKYYYPSEYNALTAVLGKALTFAVLGLLLEAYEDSFSLERGWKRTFRILSVLSTAGLLIEVAQVYVAQQIADSTDVFIYILGGLFGCAGFRYLLYGTRVDIGNSSITHRGVDTPTNNAFFPRNWMALPAVIGGTFLSLSHPGWPFVQTMLVWLVACLAWYRRDLYPMLFVLFLVVGDAYPWTGQLAIQEFDSLLLGATGGYLWSTKGLVLQPWQPSDRLLRLGWLLLSLSVAVGLFVGLYRLPGCELGDQLSVYFTKWNALRIGKGFLWGLLLYRLTGNFDASEVSIWRIRFLQGMLVAGLYVGTWVLVERAVFPGLLNLTDIYRATGPFFTMHIGDQHIDAFLVLVFPIALGLTLRGIQSLVDIRSFARFTICFFALVLICHAVFATMSRGTVLAVGIQSLLLLVGIVVRSSKKNSGWGIPRLAILSLPLTGMFGLVIYSSLSSRFDSSIEDTKERLEHWSLVVRRGTTGLGGVMIGHGIGCFSSMMATEKDRIFPPLRWKSDGGQGFIELQSGWPIFLERSAINVSGGGRGSATIRLQALGGNGAVVNLYRVEKSLLHSYGYEASGISLGREESAEMRWPETLKSANSDENPWSRFRPVYIGVSAPSYNSIIIKNADKSPELIARTSSYPWMFTCDDHLVWRAKNFLVHAYYEQGILGVLAWTTLFLASSARGLYFLGSVSRSEQTISWLGLSIIGFGIVGMFGTLIDTPWITSLILGCMVMLRKARIRSTPGMEVSR